MRNRVLVITGSTEPNATEVLTHIPEKRVFRLNTDLLDKYLITSTVIGQSMEFEVENGEESITSRDIRSIFYRRPPTAQMPAGELGDGTRKFAESEFQRFFNALWSTPNTHEPLWVNHPLCLRRVELNKLYQLQVASSQGIATPETMVTTSPKKARAFFEKTQRRMIMKTFGSHVNDTEEELRGVFTNPVSAEDLEMFGDELRYAPVIFQNYVSKKLELRVTIVGNQTFACAIDSQASSKTVHDWRRYDFEKVAHETYQLPGSLQKKLLGCMRVWGLQFGAVDFIVTPEGEHVFLEVNPAGQWGWIQALTGMPIYQAMAKLLMDPQSHSLR